MHYIHSPLPLSTPYISNTYYLLLSPSSFEFYSSTIYAFCASYRGTSTYASIHLLPLMRLQPRIKMRAEAIAWVPKWFGLLILPVLQLVIPYILYQIAVHDTFLQGQSGESANAVANIIAVPAVFLFVVFNLVYLEVATSSTHQFLPRIFTANMALWLLCWLGYNLKFVGPNSSIGVLSYGAESKPLLWKIQHLRAGFILMMFGVLLFILALACPTGVVYLTLTLVIWLGSYLIMFIDAYIYSTYLHQEGGVGDNGDSVKVDEGKEGEDEEGGISEPLIRKSKKSAV